MNAENLVRWQEFEKQFDLEFSEVEWSFVQLHGIFVFCLGLPKEITFAEVLQIEIFQGLSLERQKILANLWEFLTSISEEDKLPLPDKLWQTIKEEVPLEDLFQSSLKEWGYGFTLAEEAFGMYWDDWIDTYGSEFDEDEDENPEDTLDVLFLFLSFFADREWTFQQWDKVWRKALELEWQEFVLDNQEGFQTSIQDWLEFGQMGREIELENKE